MKNLLQSLNKKHRTFSSQFPITNWSEKFKENLKLDFTYYSNKIEGNKIEYGDTISFLSKGIINKNSSLKDLADLENHQKVLDQVFNTFDTYKLTEESIFSIHKELMKDNIQWAGRDGLPVIDAMNIIGGYRKDQVYGQRAVGIDQKEYLDHFSIKAEMKVAIDQFNTQIKSSDINSTGKDHPLYAITEFHQKFVNDIHPFKNGNGRMVRILTNIELMKLNFPPLLLKDKKAYINAIISSEKDKNINPLFSVFIKDIEENMSQRVLSS